MSTQIQSVSFQREAVLSSLSEGPPWTVSGIALGAGDVTLGQSGIKKVWPSEELQAAAESLEGKDLVVDHNNDSHGVVGKVTKAGYKDNVGVIYEAELFDEELAEKIDNGLLEVSIRGYHDDVEQMDETEDGAKIVEGIKFDNLSIVPTGAAPSNTLSIGEHEELSMAELSTYLDELQEIEPGMWVKSDETKGITISPVEDGEVEVDIYEEIDGKWRAIGETEMFDTNSLSKWDVDEEEDIGTQKKDESEDEEENAVTSLAAEGDKVQWDSSGGMARGVVVDRQTEGCFEERIDGDVKVCAEDGDPVLLINVVQGEEGNREKSGTLVAHKESTVEETDFSLAVDAPEFEEDMMVHWQVNPEMMGKIVHVDREKQIVMVEVIEEEDGEMMPSGFTVTAGYSDIEPTESVEEMAERYDDYPEAASKNAQMALDAREETDNPNDCGTDVGWKRANQLANGESLSREQLGKMSAFNRHRQNSDMDDDEGKADCGWMMWKAWGGDEGVDWAQRKLDSIEEESAELAEESVPMPEDAQLLYPTEDDATAAGEELGIDGYHSHQLDGDTWYMPGEDHTTFIERMMELAKDDEEMAKHFEQAEYALAKHMDSSDDESEDEEEMGVEGEEDEITNRRDQKENREQSPERFVDEDIEELQEYEMHTPDWSGTTESDWSSPDMEDFDTDDLSEIADHFLISSTGFPPENFGDLKLPVVEPNGDLSRNALAAVKGGRGVSAVDGLSDDMEARIVDWVNETANEEFDENWGEEENSGYKRSRTIDDTGDEPGVQNSGPVDISLDLINKYLRIEGHHERDTVDNMLSWLFGATDLPTETMADFRMASKRFLDETPGTDSFSGLKVEQFRDWLLMHGDKSAGQREMDKQQRGELPPGKATPVHVLTGDDFWQGDKSRESELDNTTHKVINMNDEIEQKLAELSEPVAVEQSDLDELQEKADRFEEMSSTLESLKERTDILDSVDREKVEELSDADEPVVVESARYEELNDEAEQVKMVYASALAEEMPAFDAEELAESFGIESLREKYEEQVGELEEELSPEPKSGDVEEEELEERAEEETEEELEPSETDEAEQKREELRESIRSGL